MRRLFLLTTLISVLACNAQHTLHFQDMHIVFSPGPVLGMYGTILNGTDEDLVLEKVESPRFQSAEIHRSIASEGRLRMEPIDSLRIPAHEEVQLARGAIHIMLSGATRPVQEGDIIPVILTLNNTAHTIEVIVRGNP